MSGSILPNLLVTLSFPSFSLFDYLSLFLLFFLCYLFVFPFLSLTMSLPLLLAVIKKTELTKKAETQIRSSPSRKSVLKSTAVRHSRPAQAHPCARRKPTGDQSFLGCVPNGTLFSIYRTNVDQGPMCSGQK